MSELDLTAAECKATYEEIKAYVWDKHHMKVSSLSQIKRKCGLEVGQNYNPPKSENPKVPARQGSRDYGCTETFSNNLREVDGYGKEYDRGCCSRLSS